MSKTDSKKGNRYEVRFSGSGGQGLITAAIIFAEAVGIYNNKYVCQTQSYGPEARGGKSKAEVVVSNSPIDYPKAIELDLLLAMTQSSCDAYFFDLKPNGLLIVDSSLVEQYPTSRIIPIPFTEIARELIGNELVANMIALGAIGKLSGLVSQDKLEKSLLSRIPKGMEDINLSALKIGIDEAGRFDLDELPRAVMVEDEEM